MLYAKFHALNSIGVHELVSLYEIFQSNYDNAPIDVFLADLEKKTGAFLIRRKSDDRLVGFSTLGVYKLHLDGKVVKGLFSGDTIIDKAYWGSRALQTAFAWKVLLEACRNPFTRQYWLLISKGYKTYLLLSRNFHEFYPRREARAQDLRLKPLVEDYCEILFPGKLDRSTMLLDFGRGANCLKDGVANIDIRLQSREPDVQYFEQCNPTWRRGTELPCIARADLASLATLLPRYALKALGVARKRSTAAPLSSESSQPR